MEIITLSEQAYDVLEEMIVTLKLKPGTIISEGRLSSQVGIGRTPIREALQKLAHQHLVEAIPKKGIRVSEINIATHLALLETRRVLERVIVSKAATRASHEQREKLKEVADAMDAAARNRNLDEFIQIDHAFDELIGEAAQNPYATEACSPLRAHCRRFWYRYHKDEDLSEAARIHRELMEAISNQDDASAVTGSDDLIDYLEQLTRGVLYK